MTIRGILNDDILGDLRRGDHIIFGLNTQGIHPDENVGYSFVNRLIEEYGATKFKSIGENPLGTIITVEDSDYDCWFHGIVNHDIQRGWPEDDDYPFDNSYVAIEAALNQLEEEFGDEVRPGGMKSLWLGRGKQRGIGETKGDIVKAAAAMANSDMEIMVYIGDPAT